MSRVINIDRGSQCIYEAARAVAQSVYRNDTRPVELEFGIPRAIVPELDKDNDDPLDIRNMARITLAGMLAKARYEMTPEGKLLAEAGHADDVARIRKFADRWYLAEITLRDEMSEGAESYVMPLDQVFCHWQSGVLRDIDHFWRAIYDIANTLEAGHALSVDEVQTKIDEIN